MTRYGGAVAACGLAGGMDLPATVAPFILRGVSLIGINSVMCPIERRREAWRRLASDLDPRKLAAMTTEIDLSGSLTPLGVSSTEKCVGGLWSRFARISSVLSPRSSVLSCVSILGDGSLGRITE